MTEVERLIAQPWRQFEVVLSQQINLRGEEQHLRPDRVRMAPLDPCIRHVETIPGERRNVTSPHLGRGVIAPAVCGDGDGPEKLQRLDPLLAEASTVEHTGAFGEGRVREEGLHSGSDANTGVCCGDMG